MNILIVDDNKNNRMILSLLLEDYIEENNLSNIDIVEAEDGLIAVEKCKNNTFDLVLMDIMMPNMDGIEATKIIRENDKKIMIIAVSAVDDNERKKLILNNGAEDYIPKPVNADIFISRIANYITLLEARKTKVIHAVGINLFTKEIFNRHLKFIIHTEDALSEFWEYFLLDVEHKCENLSDVVRTIFGIVDTQRRLNIQSEIYVEESTVNKYFTLTNIDKIPKKVIDLTLKKNNYEGVYKQNDTLISFELPILEDTTTTTTAEVIEDKVQTIQVADTSVEKKEDIAPAVNLNSSLTLQVFDYMDEDDLYDLEEYASKLNSIMLLVGGGDVTEDEVMEIYTNLDKIGSILATYSEIYAISKALSELSVDMSSHIQEFIEHSEELGSMCKAFSDDMSNWIEQTFHTGAPSVDFMNDTIAVNCQTIGGMLKMDEAAPQSDDDFDDIFDF